MAHANYVRLIISVASFLGLDSLFFFNERCSEILSCEAGMQNAVRMFTQSAFIMDIMALKEDKKYARSSPCELSHLRTSVCRIISGCHVCFLVPRDPGPESHLKPRTNHNACSSACLYMYIITNFMIPDLCFF